MSIYSSVTQDSVANGTLQDTSGTVLTSPSLNSTTTTIPPEPSTTTTPGLYDTGTAPVDNRVSQQTGNLIHNWWVYYMKSLKKFLVDSFDDSIVTFEFNYASKSMQMKKLYDNLDLVNPSCIINLDSFQSDDNLDPQRRNSGFYNIQQTMLLARNDTTSKDVRVDFKFVNISQTILLNFTNPTDVLNYYDRLTTVYPLNKGFISYEYRTYINIHDQTRDWLTTDDTSGIIYDAAILGADNQAGMNSWEIYYGPQRWSEYVCCPNFQMTGINQLVDKQSEKYQLQISLTTLLRVPQTILTLTNNASNVKAIQVVLDIGTTRPTEFNGTPIQTGPDADLTKTNMAIDSVNAEMQNKVNSFSTLDKPICIDIDRSVYESYKMDNILYLNPKINFNMDKEVLILPVYMASIINRKAVSLYIIKDSTLNDPELVWLELGYIYNPADNIATSDVFDNLKNAYKVTNYPKQYIIDLGLDIPKEEIPETGLDILELPLINFFRIKEVFKQIGPWFDARLFIFNTIDPADESGLV